MTQECFTLQGDYNLIIVDKKSLSTQHKQNRIVVGLTTTTTFTGLCAGLKTFAYVFKFYPSSSLSRAESPLSNKGDSNQHLLAPRTLSMHHQILVPPFSKLYAQIGTKVTMKSYPSICDFKKTFVLLWYFSPLSVSYDAIWQDWLNYFYDMDRIGDLRQNTAIHYNAKDATI